MLVSSAQRNESPLCILYLSSLLAFLLIEVTPDGVGGFPGGSDGKESTCNAGDLGSIPWVGKIPQRRAWQPTPIFLPGEFHGQRSLVDYSPGCCKELDTSE